MEEESKKAVEVPDQEMRDAKDDYEVVARIAEEEIAYERVEKEEDPLPKTDTEEEPFIPFEERWSQLLDTCKQKLNNLDDDDKDGQVRDLWTSINKYVTIMAVPKEILPRARKTLLKMARKSSFKQAITIIFYALLTFLPRKAYRSWNAQQYFKKKLSRNNTDKR